MSHFVEISYTDENNSIFLDNAIKEMALKYDGRQSGKNIFGPLRKLEFIFPHFENVSQFTTNIRSDFHNVTIDRMS